MKKGRLEAFSDGVIAIIITIMVLELRVPDGADLAVLRPLIPIFLSYVLSFVYVGIYWNNHHHLFQVVHHVNGGILWANLHLLFWLSLMPFVTGWMGENHFAAWPVAVYGVVLLFCGVAFVILTRGPGRSSRQGLDAGGGRRPRLQGQDLAGRLRGRDPAGVRQYPLARRRPLRAGGAHLAGPRPADRAGDRGGGGRVKDLKDNKDGKDFKDAEGWSLESLESLRSFFPTEWRRPPLPSPPAPQPRPWPPGRW